MHTWWKLYKQAIENFKWKNAIDEKKVTLDANANWEVLLLPKDKKTIGCKWLYKVKHNANGFMNKYKTRLIVKDYSQIYDIYYEKTYNPIAKMIAIRALIIMVVAKIWSLHEMDVNTFFFMKIYKKKCSWNNYQVMWTMHIIIWLASWKKPSIIWSKHLKLDNINQYLVTNGFQISYNW